MRLLLVVLLIGIGSQASALSCMRPNLARSINMLHEADKVFHAGHGVLTVEDIPDTPMNGARFKGAFSGVFFGQGSRKTVPVTLEINCAGPWCGGAPSPKKSALVFLEKTRDGYVYHANPCGGYSFTHERGKAFALIKKCLDQGKCSEADITRMDQF